MREKKIKSDAAQKLKMHVLIIFGMPKTVKRSKKIQSLIIFYIENLSFCVFFPKSVTPLINLAMKELKSWNFCKHLVVLEKIGKKII